MIDYPIDVYYLIYKYLSHKEFPISGCWKLTNNSRKAIIKLGYDKCPFCKPENKKEKKYHRYKLNIDIHDCDICHSNYGYICCDQYCNPSMVKCKNCSKFVCTQSCTDECIFCSRYYCAMCSITLTSPITSIIKNSGKIGSSCIKCIDKTK